MNKHLRCGWRGAWVDIIIALGPRLSLRFIIRIRIRTRVIILARAGFFLRWLDSSWMFQKIFNCCESKGSKSLLNSSDILLPLLLAIKEFRFCYENNNNTFLKLIFQCWCSTTLMISWKQHKKLHERENITFACPACFHCYYVVLEYGKACDICKKKYGRTLVTLVPKNLVCRLRLTTWQTSNLAKWN